jgi:diacylglycerol kinase family enzyme
MPGLLLVNPRSGDARPHASELRRAAEQRGIETCLLRETDDVSAIVRAADADAIGVAGGDGTLAPIAALAIERNVPFVCVPYGTRNHFARDLGIDRDDPVAALDAFAGDERRIDVGRAGNRPFLNNVSLGVYAHLVHRRERKRRRREALARMRAWWIVLTQREPLGIAIDGGHTEAKLVLVANNAYKLRPLSIGERERLDEGRLHLYVVDGLIEERTGERFTLTATGGSLRAAIDGEPAVLDTPVEFTIEPRALRVLVPPRVQDGTD